VGSDGAPPPNRRRALYVLLAVFAAAAIAASLLAGLTVHRDDTAAPPSTTTPATPPTSRPVPPSSTTPPTTAPNQSTPNGNRAQGRQNQVPPGSAQNGQSSQNGQSGQSSQNGQSGQNRLGNGQNPSSPSTTSPGGGATPAPPAGGNQAFLGVEVSTAASGGAQVESVESGTPAATAGLKAGDVVVAVDGTQVGSADDLVTALQAHAPCDKVTLTVDDSSGAARTVPVTLGSR
jgi:membrane-associated protease RseP (regulator of RpoE activity)